MEDGGLSLPDGCSEGVGGNEGEIEGLSEGMRVGTHDGAYEGCNEGAGDDGAGVAQAASKSERHRECLLLLRVSKGREAYRLRGIPLRARWANHTSPTPF